MSHNNNEEWRLNIKYQSLCSKADAIGDFMDNKKHPYAERIKKMPEWKTIMAQMTQLEGQMMRKNFVIPRWQ